MTPLVDPARSRQVRTPAPVALRREVGGLTPRVFFALLGSGLGGALLLLFADWWWGLRLLCLLPCCVLVLLLCPWKGQTLGALVRHASLFYLLRLSRRLAQGQRPPTAQRLSERDSPPLRRLPAPATHPRLAASARADAPPVRLLPAARSGFLTGTGNRLLAQRGAPACPVSPVQPVVTASRRTGMLVALRRAEGPAEPLPLDATGHPFDPEASFLMAGPVAVPVWGGARPATWSASSSELERRP
jgi:hypothetical protein